MVRGRRLAIALDEVPQLGRPFLRSGRVSLVDHADLSVRDLEEATCRFPVANAYQTTTEAIAMGRGRQGCAALRDIRRPHAPAIHAPAP